MFPATFTDQLGRTLTLPQRPQRIVSLVPSQTELLAHLGLDAEVVGITKFCIHPEAWFRTKRRVGGTKVFDVAAIEALQPDLIIGNKEENAQGPMEALMQRWPVWMSDMFNLGDALQMIRQVGALTGTQATADQLALDIDHAFLNLRTPAPPRRVAYFIWRQPWMVAGGNTFINDMLLRCGLVNVFAGEASRYPEVSAAQVAAAQPEVVLLSSEPYPFKENHLAELRQLCPAAEIRLVDGELFSWYGPRLLQAPAYFDSLFGENRG